MYTPENRRTMAQPAKRHKPTRPASPAVSVPLQTGERLSKKVMALQHCSRREAEQYIEGGWVSVNAQVVEEPMFRVSDQTVRVDPHASLLAPTNVTLLLHKPADFDTLAGTDEVAHGIKPACQLLQKGNHWTQDPAVIRLLQHHFRQLRAAVPLESAASGLVVFTQDWRVLRKLTEDADLMEHELVVEVAGLVAPGLLQRLNLGLSCDGQPLPPVKVSVNSSSPDCTRLRFALKGTHPGLLAYLCERVGLQINSIKRLRIGRVALANLPPGQWRYLMEGERF